LLVGVLLILMPSPFPASANITHLPTPVFNLGGVLWRASDEVSKATDNTTFTDGWRAVERRQSVKNKAGALYGRLAEARIEGSKKRQPVAVSPSTLRIPTIQLLDCRTLTEEDVCKGLMCTWEATGCHETTDNAGPTAAPPREGPRP
jgi:hypothetical protein